MKRLSNIEGLFVFYSDFSLIAYFGISLKQVLNSEGDLRQVSQLKEPFPKKRIDYK